MCLEKINGPFVAEEDTTVWKFGVETYDGRFKSYFKGFLYEYGKTYRTEIQRQTSELVPEFITQGFHSLAHRRDTSRPQWNGDVRKCTIPKGATFYTGTFEGAGSLASDTIIIYTSQHT